ncbi:MAG: CBS domain-containing protein [Zoogloeaceae bacterium]|nr:CBS domain-containing protein [Zoogloeaceae bacterium]
MANSATEMLVGASSDFLRRFSPFNRMEPEALEFLSSRLTLAFHPRDAAILTPEMGPPRYFYIVQRGKVQARQTGGVAVTEYASLSLGPGEGFPIGAVSAQRPATNQYVAVEDCFCYQLDADDFLRLMQMSPVFHLHCTQYIASLLNQSRQQLQTTFAQRASEQQTMTTLLGQIVKGEPFVVAPETATRAALEKMHEARVGSVVITDDDKRPIGILTQSDILGRVLLAGFDLARPIREVMTTQPHQLSTTSSAYDAALAMATHGVRHLLVVDGEGRLKGVVSERDLFSLQRIGLGQIRASIEGAVDVPTLKHASRDIRQLALNLIAQGIGAEQLTQFISALNDALTRRIIDLSLDRFDLHGVEFVWLAFGSEGRHEQTLSTDQDNGILFPVAKGEDPETLRGRLLPFARSVNEDLAACGFPLCKGNIMASNPELCLTPEEWRQRFAKWIREPDPQALLNSTIFFDFRVIYGPERLGDQLRSWLNENTRNSTTFLRMMAANALDVAPPLGRIRDFVVADDGTIDLKIYGARLFVDAARILSLRVGVDSSSTVHRLRQAATKLGVSAEEVQAIIDGFHFIQLLRLRAQHLETEHDSPTDNRINPDTLNELDRRILKEAFRQARKLQLRLKMDYQL